MTPRRLSVVRTAPKKTSARRWLRLERLEDRITPASLDVQAGGLVDYTAGVGVANALTLSTDGANYTFQDAAETIALTASAIAAGFTGSGTNTVTGPNLSFSSITVDVGDGADTVTVLSLQHALTVETGSGANAVTLGGLAGVGAQDVAAPVDVHATGGSVALTIDDPADATPQTIQLTGSDVQGITPADVTFTDLGGLTLTGGSGGNTWVVTDTPAAVTTTIQGGAGRDQTTVLMTTGALDYQAAGGADDVFLGDAGSTANLQGAVAVSAGSGGSVALFVDDSADSTGQTATLTNTGVTGLTPGGVRWTPADLAALELSFGFGDDVVTVNGTPAAVTPQVRLGLGDDTITVNSVSGGLSVDGNDGNDVYKFTLGGGATTIADSSGNDTIDFSGAAAGVHVNMDSTAAQVVAPGNTITFADPSIVENFVGSPFDDTVTVQPLSAPRRIDGNAPPSPGVGDTLILDLTSPVPTPSNPTRHPTGPGDGSFTFGNYAPITYASIEVPSPTSRLVAAPASGVGVVQTFDATTGAPLATFEPYPGFLGGVSVATADLNGDGVPEIITGAGVGGPPHVKVFDGSTLALLASFYAFDPAFKGGITVAAGDVTGDGVSDLIVSVLGGAGPHVKVFDGRTFAEVRSFFAFDAGFVGGVRVAAGDVNNDGFADLIVGAGPGGGGHVKVFDGKSNVELASFLAYPGVALPFGVWVGAGDVDGDGSAEVLTGAGFGAPAHVKAFSIPSLTLEASFIAYADFEGGVRVDSVDANHDGSAEIMTAPELGPPHVKTFDGTGATTLLSFMAFDPGLTTGLFVAGG